MASNDKKYIRKTGLGGAGLYKWSPETSVEKTPNNNTGSGHSCSAPIGTQGNDNSVTYTYNVVVVLGQATRTAYVQCDYVE
tara:strand:+ start:249 stop:491 length:243 start_codon:yes stop_codon:yes gene_type:complete